jgi:transaldolase
MLRILTGTAQILKLLDPKFGPYCICIKIPRTWEGPQACKMLQSNGIATLATTLFTVEQAVLAGEALCHYIAPYVNELLVYFDAGFVDNNKTQKVCVEAQNCYENNGIKTKILAASLTSMAKIMELTIVHHKTIAQALLEDETPTTFELYAGRKFGDEAGYKMAFTRSGNGEGERK